ncbi:BF3164 family lipoprotein [Flavobacterium magnesitis]|uniref:BF3164 family lipoprotein n=1 Tax=Flavobacterium magnesitis TaxID=3138077 RepID=UPI00358FFF4D
MDIYNKYLNNRKLIMLSLIMFLILMSCKHNDKIVLNKNITLFSKFPQESNISFKELYEYNKGVPSSLFLVDSTLIIFNFNFGIDSFFYNYSLKNGQLSKGYLKKGKGPGESIGGFCAGLSENNLWVYDLNLKKILLTDKTKAIANINPPFHTLNLKNDYYKIAILDSSQLLVNGIRDSKYKIQKVDFSGKVLNEFGEFKQIPKDMPLNVLKDATHSFFFLNPSMDRFAMSYLHTDVLEIYDLKEPFKSKAVQGPSVFDIDFKIGKGINYDYMQVTKETKKAFIAGAVTDKYIYLVYSGTSYGDKNDWNYGKFIYIYDWSGNPVRKLNLDRSISGLYVTNDDKTIYSYDIIKGFLVEAKIN